MAENAAGVRSMTRWVRHWPLQQVCSLHQSWTFGPQSAMVTQTLAPEHWCLTFITEPQPRLGMFSPQAPGLVTLKQAAEALGHAAMFLLDWQVPQAPVPALPQGPQELPQQNQEPSPAHRLVDPQAIAFPFVGLGCTAGLVRTWHGISVKTRRLP